MNASTTEEWGEATAQQWGAETRREQREGRRAGYLVAAFVNLVVLWIVNNLLSWGWPPFLTESFTDLLPILNASIIATIVLNVLWAVADRPWFKHLGQVGLNVLGMAVAIRTWQVFPFDFSTYSAVWDTVARVLLGVSFFALAVATLVELVRFTIDSGTPTAPPPARRHDGHHAHPAPG